MSQTLDPLTFEVGHHTDLWIARRVMEWPDMKEFEPIHDYFHFGGVVIGGDRPTFFRYGTIPDSFLPSSKMEDALEVLHKMKTKGWWYSITSNPKHKSIMAMFGQNKEGVMDLNFVSAEAETEPLAICRAAGMAVFSDTYD